MKIQVYGFRKRSKRTVPFLNSIAIILLMGNQKQFYGCNFFPIIQYMKLLEIIQGITDIFEIGAYTFTNYTPGYGYKIISTHIRPRIMAPAKWNLPVGLSLSTEIGLLRFLAYSDQTWSLYKWFP